MFERQLNPTKHYKISPNTSVFNKTIQNVLQCSKITTLKKTLFKTLQFSKAFHQRVGGGDKQFIKQNNFSQNTTVFQATLHNFTKRLTKHNSVYKTCHNSQNTTRFHRTHQILINTRSFHKMLQIICNTKGCSFVTCSIRYLVFLYCIL